MRLMTFRKWPFLLHVRRSIVYFVVFVLLFTIVYKCCLFILDLQTGSHVSRDMVTMLHDKQIARRQASYGGQTNTAAVVGLFVFVDVEIGKFLANRHGSTSYEPLTDREFGFDNCDKVSGSKRHTTHKNGALFVALLCGNGVGCG